MSSLFQAMIRSIKIIRAGTRCIAKSLICSQRLSSGENESNAKKLIKKIINIVRIRGTHEKPLLLVAMNFIL